MTMQHVEIENPDIESLKRLADAKVAEIRDGMDDEAVARIEREHSEICERIATARAAARKAGERVKRVSQDQERVLRDLGERHGLTPMIDVAIDAGLDEKETRKRVLDALAERSDTSGPQGSTSIGTSNHMGHNHTTLDDPRNAVRAASDALYSVMSGKAPEGAAVELLSRGGGFKEIDDGLARLTGRGSWLGGSSDKSARSFGGHTTSDFPIALGNAAGRRLRDMMALAETGAGKIAAVGTVDDFRPVTEIQTSSFPALSKLNEHGEIQAGTIDETGESYRAESFARRIDVTYQVLRNDDVGFVERAVRDVAIAANNLKASLILAAFNTAMRDGQPLFHATHNNLAGSGSVIGVGSLGTGRAAMRNQTAVDGVTPLGLAPAILLVPSSLETIGEQVVASITATKAEDANPFGGRLMVAAEPRLQGNAWYLFADPSFYAAIKFVTLTGHESPAFETNPAWESLGVSWRVHWHVGAGPVDHRGAFQNPGA